MAILVLDKIYTGFESVLDIEGDIDDALNECEDIPPEFTGDIRIRITYEDKQEE